VVRMMLEELGLEADEAAGGIEAVERARQRAYDLILMDVQMPDIDGLDATRRIRQQVERGAAPFILALTANVMESDEARCREAGMNGFLPKPLRLTTLEATIGAFVASRPWRGKPAFVRRTLKTRLRTSKYAISGLKTPYSALIALPPGLTLDAPLQRPHVPEGVELSNDQFTRESERIRPCRRGVAARSARRRDAVGADDRMERSAARAGVPARRRAGMGSSDSPLPEHHVLLRPALRREQRRRRGRVPAGLRRAVRLAAAAAQPAEPALVDHDRVGASGLPLEAELPETRATRRQRRGGGVRIAHDAAVDGAGGAAAR